MATSRLGERVDLSQPVNHWCLQGLIKMPTQFDYSNILEDEEQLDQVQKAEDCRKKKDEELAKFHRRQLDQVQKAEDCRKKKDEELAKFHRRLQLQKFEDERRELEASLQLEELLKKRHEELAKFLRQFMPVRQVDRSVLSSRHDGKIQVTWIGDATVLTQFDGINILSDAVLRDFCGLEQAQTFKSDHYHINPWAACTAKDIPELDVVIISHNHFDHLDRGSVTEILREHKDVTWYVPVKMKKWFMSHGVTDDKKVIEMTLWEDHVFEKNGKKFTFTCLPAQHLCQRGASDLNKVLRCSWAVKGPDHSYFFGGSTGYHSSLFKRIGQHYGPFSLAALPIGAHPRYETMPMKRWDLNSDLSGKRKLRKTSHFASLLIEIGAALSSEEFSAFKLAVSVDKLLSRRKLSDMQNATDLLRLLWEEVIISATDTHFLEHLLEKVGRKDLEKLVVQYREKKQEFGENTPPDETTKVKTVASPPFTRLKQPSTSCLMFDVHSDQDPAAMGNIPQFVLDEGDGSLLKSEPFSFPAQPLQASQFSKYREITEFQHFNPEDAVNIHQDIRSNQSVGIHWGTFELTNEFFLESTNKLKEHMIRKQKDPKEFISLTLGETWIVGEERQESPFMGINTVHDMKLA